MVANYIFASKPKGQCHKYKCQLPIKNKKYSDEHAW